MRPPATSEVGLRGVILASVDVFGMLGSHFFINGKRGILRHYFYDFDWALPSAGRFPVYLGGRNLQAADGDGYLHSLSQVADDDGYIHTLPAPRCDQCSADGDGPLSDGTTGADGYIHTLELELLCDQCSADDRRKPRDPDANGYIHSLEG